MTVADVNAKAIAVKILSEGGTQEEAAKAAGVHRVTVANWKAKDADFISALEKAGKTQAQIAQKGLAYLLPQALKVYEGALTGNPDRYTSIRLKAAGEVIKRLQEFEKAQGPRAAMGHTPFEDRLAELTGTDDQASD
jgi:hypothetical protein